MAGAQPTQILMSQWHFCSSLGVNTTSLVEVKCLRVPRAGRINTTVFVSARVSPGNLSCLSRCFQHLDQIQ